MTENSIPIEIHHVQKTLIFVTHEEAVDLVTSFFQKKSLSFFFKSNHRNRQYARKYISSNRLASRLRSRSASASRRFVTNKQPISSANHDHYTESFSKSKDNFQDNIYRTEMINAITPTGWFYSISFYSQNETVSNLASRLGIVFLRDSGASILVANIPTY